MADPVFNMVSMPVEDVDLTALGVELNALAPRGMITVRGDLADQSLQAAVKDICGCDVPAMRRANLEDEQGALWMSPDELMLFVPYGEAAERAARINGSVERHAVAVDVSDARVLVELKGEAAPVVLAKGAPVDLAPRWFDVGEVRRTRIGQIAAAFIKTSAEPPCFTIMCFRSYATYLANWLETAAQADSLNDLNFGSEGVVGKGV